jgi:hypothetical protein
VRINPQRPGDFRDTVSFKTHLDDMTFIRIECGAQMPNLIMEFGDFGGVLGTRR